MTYRSRFADKHALFRIPGEGMLLWQPIITRRSHTCQPGIILSTTSYAAGSWSMAPRYNIARYMSAPSGPHDIQINTK